MTTCITGGLVLLPEGIFRRNVYLRGGVIGEITEAELPHDREIPAEGKYVAPGFIDLHVHGGDGAEFVDGTPEAVRTAANLHARHGTTTIFPTISAYQYEKTAAALEAIRNCLREGGLLPELGGVHLEGPYFSPAQSGAQDPSYIRNPDPAEYRALADEYGELIRRWSYAPELPGSVEFQRELNARGIVGSAGHTDAEFSDMAAAYENGLRLITHLYSCNSTIRRRGGFRILGVIESAYYFEDITAEIIADGCHLPPELIRLVWRQKGERNVCLVTDAIRYGGMSGDEPISDPNGNVPYIIEDGVAKLADRSAFAGSIATMDRLVRTCVKKAGIPLDSAVRMATEVPARVMGLPRKGRIQPGFDADLVLFNEEIEVSDVLIKGNPISR